MKEKIDQFIKGKIKNFYQVLLIKPKISDQLNMYVCVCVCICALYHRQKPNFSNM